MAEFYSMMTFIFIAAGVFIFALFLLTFDVGVMFTALKEKRKKRAISRARKAIEKYNPEAVLTENERKAIVLEFLDERQMFVTGGAKE